MNSILAIPNIGTIATIVACTIVAAGAFSASWREAIVNFTINAGAIALFAGALYLLKVSL